MISYLVEASICMACFYVCYRFFLSKEKLLQINRFYLLITAVVSLIIPLLNIPLAQYEKFVFPLDSRNGSSPLVHAAESPDASYPFNPWLFVYCLGLSISLIAFLYKLGRLIYTIKTSSKQKIGRYWHLNTDKNQVFSFMHFLFTPSNQDIDEPWQSSVLTHEKVHARQLHSLDLLFFNLMTVFFWFNPFSYSYRSAAKLQHEFIADAAVAEKQGKSSYSQSLIKHCLSQSGLPITHAFSEHPIERRLKMIDNLNPTKMKKLRILLSLPILGALLFTISCSQSVDAQESVEIQEKKTQIIGALAQTKDAAKAPATLKGKVQRGLDGLPLSKVTITAYPSKKAVSTDNNGQYLLESVTADTLLVFSKPGFADQRIPRKNFSVLNVALSQIKKE